MLFPVNSQPEYFADIFKLLYKTQFTPDLIGMVTKNVLPHKHIETDGRRYKKLTGYGGLLFACRSP